MHTIVWFWLGYAWAITYVFIEKGMLYQFNNPPPSSPFLN